MPRPTNSSDLTLNQIEEIAPKSIDFEAYLDPITAQESDYIDLLDWDETNTLSKILDFPTLCALSACCWSSGGPWRTCWTWGGSCTASWSGCRPRLPGPSSPSTLAPPSLIARGIAHGLKYTITGSLDLKDEMITIGTLVLSFAWLC